MSENKVDPLLDWDGFFKELQTESPRAAVIIACAFLDAQMRTLLTNSLIDEQKVVEGLLDSELSSFNSRIKIAYCMGLISKSVFDDLDTIRKIRNKFAHKMHGYSFDEPEIVGWCSSLKLAKMVAEATSYPRAQGDLFILGVTLLASHLGMKIVETGKLKKKTPKNPVLAQVVNVGSK
jgi:DNA-binding MltR family transcriptional regulator